VRVLSAALALILLAASARAADVESTLDVRGVPRHYLLHMPAGNSERVPLVLVFHGGGGRASGMQKLAHFDEAADRHGFLLVYPDGIDRHWNDGRTEGGADDVGFVAALVKDLSARYPVDPHRVFATGISNGGFFSQTLACRMADTFAAVASVAATMGESLVPACKPVRSISVMFVMGDQDPLVPIGGGAVARTRGMCVSLDAAVRFWKKANGISAQRIAADVPDRDPNDGTRTRRDSYRGGGEGAVVEKWVVENGGHTWPGGLQYLPKFLIGATSRDFDATEEILKFFEAHGRKPEPPPVH
jgi:polyhydroxybutyrate depolymerase